MAYVDGYIIPVPVANKQQYLELAERVAPVFKEHGAIKIVECWGDDVPDGEVTSFPMAVKCKQDEAIVFSWIIWPSREVRDKGLKAAMEDERMNPAGNPPPFDGKRMIFGGFDVIVDD